MTNILIADDHALVRAGLKQFLADDQSIGVLGEAASGQETLDKLASGAWDLLILDINMPDRGGLDILRHVRAGFPAVRVLIVSGFPERQYAVNALRCGAHGYLAKDAAPADLMKAVQVLLRGRRYISATLAELLASDFDVDHEKPLHAQLSEREFQIFCKLAAGRSVSQIAAELYLSVKTISTYRSRVLEKMQFVSNADITTYAIRNGMLN